MDDFELLSSMSPKLIGTKKSTKFNKAATKLSLKKNIRRSIVLDSLKVTPKISDLLLVEASSSEPDSTSNESSKANNTLTITISDSECSIEETRQGQIFVDPKVDKVQLRESKHGAIKDWVSRVNSENDKGLSCEGNVGYNKPETSSNDNVGLFNSVLQKNGKVSEGNNSSSALNNSFSFDEAFVNKLDESFLTRMRKKLGNNYSSNIDNKDTADTRSKNDSDTSERGFNRDAEWCDKTGKEERDEDSCCSTNKSEVCSTNNDLDDFKMSLLDQIYGDKWRENKEQVLTPVVPKIGRPIKKSTSELKPKKSVSYKKSHLDNKFKSFSNVKPSKKPGPSWVKRLQYLCDSDTSESDSLTNDCTKTTKVKLDFDSDSSYNVPKSSILKATDVNNRSAETNVKKSLRIPISKLNKENAGSTSDSNDEMIPKNTNSVITLKKPDSKSKECRKKQNMNVLESFDRNNESSCKKPENQHYSFLKSLSGFVDISECDPSARVYRNSFKTSKEKLAMKLFNLYNSNIFENKIPEDTALEWNNRMMGTAGYCYCKKITRRTGTIERQARIVLATKVLSSADRLRDTLVHEMCHAATWIVNEVSDGHGPNWKAWAQKAMSVFPELPPIKRCHDYVIDKKYTYKCTDCGYSFGRHSKSLDMERKRCGHCYGKFELFINKKSKSGEVKSVPITPKKPPTGFALFVKENYANIKRPQLQHADVMKILGENFSKMKVQTK